MEVTSDRSQIHILTGMSICLALDMESGHMCRIYLVISMNLRHMWRRFFSTLVQRAAKMHRRKGGGSLTLLLVLPGKPATGRAAKQVDPAKFQHLSPELRAKLEAALAAQAADSAQASSSGQGTEVRFPTIQLMISCCCLSTVCTIERLPVAQMSMCQQVQKLKGIVMAVMAVTWNPHVAHPQGMS